MFEESAFHLLHGVVGLLQTPVVVILFGLCCWSVLEIGIGFGERIQGLAKLRELKNPAPVIRIGGRRIGRVGMLMRLGPMFGLMGTLIPLGPGLAALGRGEFAQLAGSVIVAFDTTVLGLCVGVVGFLLHTLRKSWYDALLDELEAADGVQTLA